MKKNSKLVRIAYIIIMRNHSLLVVRRAFTTFDFIKKLFDTHVKTCQDITKQSSRTTYKNKLQEAKTNHDDNKHRKQQQQQE
mmetsp:Transcript_19557/g.47202  ORF Transcript_19557/g.47202 Transcript_19557/m.47202 type:complete len:82 (+) Transcript_19557:86-331(+)